MKGEGAARQAGPLGDYEQRACVFHGLRRSHSSLLVLALGCGKDKVSWA